MALLLIVLAAIILTSVTTAISRKWNAVEQELYVQQELMTYNPATTLLDLCMAGPSAPEQITKDPPSPTPLSAFCGYNGWTTIVGASGCGNDGRHARCWRVIDFDDEPVELVSGVGQRKLVEIQIQIAVGCHGSSDPERDCDRLGLIERRYYRNTFLQYQVHYDSQTFSPGVVHAHDSLVGEQIAFVTGDLFNGPVRLNDDKVLYCGSPVFTVNPSILDPTGQGGLKRHTVCQDVVSRPLDSITPPQALLSRDDVTREDALLAVEAVDCTALGVLPVAVSDANGWADTRSLLVDRSDQVDILALQPAPPDPNRSIDVSAHPGKVLKFDMADPSAPDPSRHSSYDAAALRVHGTLDAGQSVAVVATGDIIVSDDLRTPDNSSGETGLISLISQCGDVRIEPDLAGATCLDSTLYPTHSIRLQNVAVLAPNGSMWMPDWETPRCAAPAGIPTFTFEGSVASGYMGLHGEANVQGVADTGWTKSFSYPESFWLRRPLWWPRMSGGEWLPLGLSDTSVDTIPTIEPGLVVSVVTLTVDEGRSSTFTVNLNTVPSAPVTVSVVSGDPSAAAVDARTASLTFTTTDFGTPQTVTVNAPDDSNDDDKSTTVTLTTTSTDSGYNGLTARVAITITDDDIPPALIVAPASVSVAESATATFTVALASRPSGPVTVTVSSDNAVATVDPASLTFPTSDWSTPQQVDVTGTDNAACQDVSTSAALAATNGGYDTVSASVPVTVTDDDNPNFSASDAAAYVAARDHLLTEMEIVASFGTITPATWNNTYRYRAGEGRGIHGLSTNVPLLGEKTTDPAPYSLPNPSTSSSWKDDLQDALDAQAVAACLPQALIDAAESG